MIPGTANILSDSNSLDEQGYRYWLIEANSYKEALEELPRIGHWFDGSRLRSKTVMLEPDTGHYLGTGRYVLPFEYNDSW